MIQAIALRTEAARRLTGGSSQAVLRSVVEATVALFHAEAASIALYDPPTNRLVFSVAAGVQGQGVVGVSIAPDQGIAGYVFTTGQALALSDVASDPRFGRDVAERTAYLPRSIVAVPLVDDRGTIGVLEVLDKRDEDSFSLRDIELAGVFARQAAVAITASRVERDTAELLRTAIRLAAGPEASSEGVDELVQSAVAGLVGDADDDLWRVADLLARLRTADPGHRALLADILDVFADHAERAARSRRSRR